MGCTSSKEAVQASATSTTSPSKREKSITGGTEASSVAVSTQHDTAAVAAAVAAADTTKQLPQPNAATAKPPKSPTNSAPPQADVSGQLVLANSGLTVRYACCSQRGRDPEDAAKPNQDRFGFHERLLLEEKEEALNANENGGNLGSTGNNNSAAAFFGVYDGHGPDGQACAHFCQEKLPTLIRTNLRTQQRHAGEGAALSVDQLHFAMLEAHVDCNDQLHGMSNINDNNSGTTAISVYIQDGESTDGGQPSPPSRITVSNVGDSRAILGTGAASSKTLQAVPLSQDHTPRRPDEAGRCVKSGARILSFGQIDPSSVDDDDDDDEEDPPRVWSKKGKYPGTAFTRSMGDAVAETLGVFAEPEMLTLKLSAAEQVIVLASDGVYDVLSNQQVVDLCLANQENPLQACQAVLEKSHQEWLLNEDCGAESGEDDCDDDEEALASYDDMTIICIFLDHHANRPEQEQSNAAALAPSSQPQPKHHSKRVRQKTLRNLEEMDEG